MLSVALGQNVSITKGLSKASATRVTLAFVLCLRYLQTRGFLDFPVFSVFSISF